jgi:hypothetical protein
MILDHIYILCGNDIDVFDYFIKWIAQMIQFPAVKSICPTMISKQGAGKTTLNKLFSKMFGNKKVFETTSPSRDVWGSFNGIMANAFLVNLNELSKKEMLECEGYFKGLVTDGDITINNKGVNAFILPSYHRFFATTNNEEPMPTSKDDRRNLIIRSSDEKCGDKEYFVKLYDLLDDVNVIKTAYEYFKSVEGVENFNSIPIPKTEYQTNLKELSVSPIELWLRELVMETDKVEIEKSGSEIYIWFKQWCESNGVKYEINAQKLGVRISNMKIAGISKGEHTMSGKIRKFNIPMIKKHFGIN